MERLIILMFIAVLINGCVLPDAKPDASPLPKKVDQPSSSVTYAVTAASNEVFLGDDVYVTVTLINIGFDKLKYEITTWPLTLWERDARRNGVAINSVESGMDLPTDGARASAELVNLVHGQCLTYTFKMNNFFDLSAPGKYEFTISRRLWNYASGKCVPFDLVGNATVTIKPPDTVPTK